MKLEKYVKLPRNIFLKYLFLCNNILNYAVLHEFHLRRNIPITD